MGLLPTKTPTTDPNISAFIKKTRISEKNPDGLGPIKKEDYHIFNHILDVIGRKRKDNKLLVMGDVMLDHFMYCHETEIDQSQKHNLDEDFTFNESDPEHWYIGGAAHVALACSEVCDVILFGVIGSDGFGIELKKKAIEFLDNNKRGITKLHPVNGYITVTKMYATCIMREKESEDPKSASFGHSEKKIIEKKLRINREFNEKSGQEIIFQNVEDYTSLLREFEESLNMVNGIIFKDHQKGLLSDKGSDKSRSKEFLKTVIDKVNDKISETEKNHDRFFVFIDPKYQWKKFHALKKIHGILPNIKEAAAGIYPNEPNVWRNREESHTLMDKDWELLDNKFGKNSLWEDKIDCIPVTGDENGATLYRPSGGSHRISVSPLDVGLKKKSEIGCGDVFDAFFIGCMMNKEVLEAEYGEKFYTYALQLANHAAGVKVTKGASDIVTIAEMKNECRSM